MKFQVLFSMFLVLFCLNSYSDTSKFKKAITDLNLPPSTTLNILYPKGSKANLAEISKIFEKRFSIKVELIEGSLDEISAELILNQRLGVDQKTIDIAVPATFAIPDLATSKVIIPLSSLETKFSEMLKPASSLYQIGDFYDGDRYGFQTDGDTYMMFYNKAFLENKKYQKEYEDKFSKKLDIPKTWNELDRQIKFFHRPKQGLAGGILFRNKNYIGWEFLARLHAEGILPFDKNFKPNINNKSALKVLEAMLSLNKFMVADLQNINLFENFKLYKAGNVYANIGWGGSQKAFMAKDSKVSSSLVHSLLPGGSSGVDNSAYFNWGWSFVITERSKNKELAYLFTKFATTPEMSVLSVGNAGGFFDPYQPAHYTNPQIKKIYTQEFLKVHRKSLVNSIPDFYVASRAEYMNTLNRALFAASTGQLSAEVALVAVSKAWSEINKKVGQKEQSSRWQKILQEYPETYRKKLSL